MLVGDELAADVLVGGHGRGGDGGAELVVAGDVCGEGGDESSCDSDSDTSEKVRWLILIN